MKVIQLLAGARHGGAEKFFERFVFALKKHGLQQIVITRPHPERMQLFKDHDIPVISVPFSSRFFDWKTPYIIKKTAKLFKPDIVMSLMSRASHLCPKGSYVQVARLGGYYDLKYYKKNDYLIGITKDLVQHCRKGGWKEDKVKYLPNFAEETTSLPIDRKIHDTPNDVPLLLALGRLHQVKGFDTLINALVKIPKAYLWIAGSGPLENELKNLVETHGLAKRVRFLGWQQDTAPLFAAADIIVFPSRYEPLGSVVLEAWLHRRPLVSTRSAGPESLIDHGVTGLLCSIDESDEIAHEVNKLIENPQLAKSLQINGYQHYQEFFTEKAVCEQYLNFFKEIVDQQRMR